MNRVELLKQTVQKLTQLPEKELSQIADFADYLLTRAESQVETIGIQQLIEQDEAFSFLHDEKELYAGNDTVGKKY